MKNYCVKRKVSLQERGWKGEAVAGCESLKGFPVTEEVDMCTIPRGRIGTGRWVCRAREELPTLESSLGVGCAAQLGTGAFQAEPMGMGKWGLQGLRGFLNYLTLPLNLPSIPKIL